LGPGGHFFREVLKLRVSKIARGPKSGSAGNTRLSSAGNVFCRRKLGRESLCRWRAGGKMSSAGDLMRARCHLRWAGWFPCRAADVKHLSAGSLPGTPVGRAVVLMVIIIR